MKLTKHRLSRTVVLLLAALFLAGLAPADQCAAPVDGREGIFARLFEWLEWHRERPVPQTRRYRASIRRTSFGIPHVKARDWGSLGYGVGYAFASDNLCVLAREIVAANGQLSRYFGPEEGNLESDLFYTFWSTDEVVDRFLEEIDGDLRALVRGYAAGYNRYLRDTGRAHLPAECRDAPWVREIDIHDLGKVYYKQIGLAGTPNLVDPIMAAAPPPPIAAAESRDASLLAGVTIDEFRAATPLELPERGALGSNMVALGRDATGNGRGMVLVNPHFPWTGPLRFYQMHVTIPGVIDSMGAALAGSPLPMIAFNKHVAWSHTVSAASRFVIYQLEIVPEDPTTYLFDGEIREITAETVSVEVLEPDGSIGTREHIFYSSHFGPILMFPPFLGWNPVMAFTIFDANRENFRIFKHFLRMNRARSVDDVARALEEEIGLPWVNTAAADRSGKAYYADIGAMPNITNQQIADCPTPASPFLAGMGLVLLDGSRSECSPGTDPDAPQPGIFGANNLPSLRRSDYVQNSNDPYWLTHPDELLEGFSAILGGERQEPSLRTRLGILQVQQRLAGTDGLAGDRFELESMLELVYRNRSLSAELMVDDVLTLCAEEPNLVELGTGTVDVGEACALLDAWDRTHNLESVGALIWRELWPRMVRVSDLYAVPFDVNDPVNTPRGVNLGSAPVRDAVMWTLARTVQFLADNDLPLDAPWGDVHFERRNDERIPMHGGPGGQGVYNLMITGFSPGEGYTPMVHGSSIITVVTFDKRGPVARGVLTYSQSTDPESPHFGDQTRLFSEYGINPLPFHERDIRRDPEYSVLRLRERWKEFRDRR